jgi:hypothetical protein
MPHIPQRSVCLCVRVPPTHKYSFSSFAECQLIHECANSPATAYPPPGRIRASGWLAALQVSWDCILHDAPREVCCTSAHHGEEPFPASRLPASTAGCVQAGQKIRRGTPQPPLPKLSQRQFTNHSCRRKQRGAGRCRSLG